MEKFRKWNAAALSAEVFHSGMDAAAHTAVIGIADAGNAKGVFYDN